MIGHSVVPAREVTLQTIADDLAIMQADLALIKASLANVESDVALIQDETPDKDEDTGGIPVLTTEHAMIHAGKHFFCRDANEIGSGSSVDFMLTTPATGEIHILPVFDFTAITTISFYAGADRNGTTLLSRHNNNGLSATAATLLIHRGTSGGTTDGSLLCTYKSGVAAGASTRVGGRTGAAEELILAQNTKFIFRVASSTAGNLTNVIFTWYEVT